MNWRVYIQVRLMRGLLWINDFVDHYLVSPRLRSHAFTVTVPVELSARSGHIKLYFYTPRDYQKSRRKDYPLIIDLHGGGFSIGTATNDARWANTLLDRIDAVLVSVDYRQGPEHPQPTANSDCVDALRWLWAHASEYGLDKSRTVLTGFSAGGNLALTTPLRHYIEQRNNASSGNEHDGKITGIVAFYPSTNQTIPRPQKVESNPVSKVKGSIGPRLYALMDAAYYQDTPPAGRGSVNLSPALASDEALRGAFPAWMAIYTCEYDQLLVEGEDFRRRLLELGIRVDGHMVKGMAHGFDKRAGKFPAERDAMYQDAATRIKAILQQ